MDGLVVVNSFCGWAGAVLEFCLKDTGGSRENVGEGASRKWMPCKPPMTLVVVSSFCGWANAVLEFLLQDTRGSRENVGEGASRKWMPCKPPMTLAPQRFYSSIGNGKGNPNSKACLDHCDQSAPLREFHPIFGFLNMALLSNFLVK